VAHPRARNAAAQPIRSSVKVGHHDPDDEIAAQYAVHDPPSAQTSSSIRSRSELIERRETRHSFITDAGFSAASALWLSIGSAASAAAPPPHAIKRNVSLLQRGSEDVGSPAARQKRPGRQTAGKRANGGDSADDITIMPTGAQLDAVKAEARGCAGHVTITGLPDGQYGLVTQRFKQGKFFSGS